MMTFDDGIYSVYMAGADGLSFAVLMFRDNIIAGADGGGGIYDGNYSIQDGQLTGQIKFTLPIGGASITGASASGEPLIFDVPIQLPVSFDPEEFFRIETPVGPVNAKFEKIRGFE